MTEQNLDVQFEDYEFEIIESFIGSRRSTRLPVRLLEDMINTLPLGYVITACHQKKNPIVLANSSFEKITGYSCREVMGHNCFFLLGKDTGQEALDQFREAVRLKQQHTEIVRNYRKDGSLFYNELTVVPVDDHLNNTKYLIWLQRDVTPEVEEKKKLFEQLQLKDKRFAAYMDNSNEALWCIEFNPPISLDAPHDEQVQAVFDRGVFTEMNDIGAKIYGLKQGRDAIGKPLKKFMPKTIQENRERVCELVRNVFRLDQMITKESGADKESHVILNNITPYFKNGSVSYIWGASIDVTELYAAQSDLELSKEELSMQKQALEKKNIALKELIAHIELEKKELHDRINSNLEHILLPSLKRISLNRGEATYIEHHRVALENLTSSFGTKVNDIRVKLTPREMEVCDLVKNGMVTKDIARLLKIAPHTVEKHRRMARKKLGIANKGINLHSYLNSL